MVTGSAARNWSRKAPDVFAKPLNGEILMPKDRKQQRPV
jgi:hypothetical protein